MLENEEQDYKIWEDEFEFSAEGEKVDIYYKGN